MRRTTLLVVLVAIVAAIFVTAAYAATRQNYVGTVGGATGTISSSSWAGTGNAIVRQNNNAAPNGCIFPNTHYWLRVRYVRPDSTVWQFSDAIRGSCLSVTLGSTQGQPMYAQCKIMHDSGYADISRQGWCWSDF